VTQKFVSQGDSISAGQQIATISKTALTKVQFYVDKNDLSNFRAGTKISINEDGNVIDVIVSNVASEADPTTRRFLIEAKPAGKNPLLIGSVISVSLEITKTPDTQGNLILPLSAITISQNESYIFIAENNHAKKVSVSVEKVQGEYAEVKTNIAKDAKIIIGGSKLVGDGEEIKITN
jgi:multidrug resistance efflux pump